MDAPDGIRCTSSSADITLASLPEWDFLSQRNCQPLSDESVGGVLNACFDAIVPFSGLFKSKA